MAGWQTLFDDVSTRDIREILLLDTIAGAKKCEIVLRDVENLNALKYFDDIEIWSPGLNIDGGLKFDGVDDHIELADTLAMDSDDWSISWWMKNNIVWLDGWDKRKKIILTGGSSGAQTDYPMRLEITYDSDMQPDFDDLRFADSDGNLVDAWLESKANSGSAVVWVKFPITPADGIVMYYYMYYDNISVSNIWDGEAVFRRYDGFEDGDTTISGNLFELASNYAHNIYPHNGIYGIRCPSGGVWQKSQSFYSDVDSIIIGGFVYCQDVTNHLASVLISDNVANTWGGYLKFDGGKVYAMNNSTWIDIGETYNATDYIKFEILQGATTYQVRINNGSWCGLYTNIFANTINNISHISIRGDDVYGYFDDIFITKQISNPPTYIISGEYLINERIFSKSLSDDCGYIEMRSNNTIVVKSATLGVWTGTFYTNTNINDLEWHHYVLNFSSIDTKLYIDGALSYTVSSNSDSATFDLKYLGFGNSLIGEWQSPDSATASDDDGTHTADLSVDGNTSTYWKAAAFGASWIYFDLGTEISLDKIRLMISGSVLPITFDLEKYINGTGWVVVVSSHTTTTPDVWDEINFSEIATQYIRLNISGNWGNCSEFEIPTPETFGGTLADVRIYDEAIDTDEIARLYVGKYATACKAFYILNQSSAVDDAIYDRMEGSHGTSYTGVATKGALTVDTAPLNQFIAFKGRIENMLPDYDTNTISITGRDYISVLLRRACVESYTTQLRSYIVNDMLLKYGDSMTRRDIDASPAGTTLTYLFKTSAWDAIIKCAKEDGYRFWVDVDKDFHYHSSGYLNSGITIEIGVSDILEYNVNEMGSEVVNRVTVYGEETAGTQIIVMVEDIDSQEYYNGIFEKRIVDASIDTEADAIIIGNKYIEKHSYVLDIVELQLLGYENLIAGELIHLKLPDVNIDGTYLIIEKQLTYPKNITKIKVAKYVKNLEGMIADMVEKILNLERYFMEEGSAVVKIHRINEAILYTDRIVVDKKATNDSFLIGNPGWCTIGITKIGGRGGSWTNIYDSG